MIRCRFSNYKARHSKYAIGSRRTLTKSSAFVRVPPDDSIATLRERALVVALADAVRRHEIAKEVDIADRSLSVARVRNFVAEAYDSIFSSNVTERLFARVGAVLYLAPKGADAPKERGVYQLLAKAPFTDQPSTGPFSDVYVAEYGHLPHGAAFEHDVMQRLGEELGDAPVIEAPLDTPEAVLRAIDQALDALDSQSEAFIFLPERKWIETLKSLDHDETRPAEYEPHWMMQEIGEWARYRGHLILLDLEGESGDRSSLYVVEPGTWGCFVRAQVEGGTDLRVKSRSHLR